MKKKELLISIVIPSYNSEKYIGQTLSSILNQKYPNLEIIIQDGGSIDSTISIIKSFDNTSITLYNEEDSGQYNAINKGFSKAKGDIFCWLNSDDIQMPWTLNSVNEIFNLSKDISWIIGKNSFINDKGIPYKSSDNDVVYPKFLVKGGFYNDKSLGFLQQENMFWRREVWEYSNGLNENYDLASDFVLWRNFANKYSLYSVNIPLCAFRIHDSNRSLVEINKYRLEIIDNIREDFNLLSYVFIKINFIKYLSFLFYSFGHSVNFRNNKIFINYNIKPIFKYSILKYILNAQN